MYGPGKYLICREEEKRWKWRKIFGEWRRKRTEKEKEDNIWRREMVCLWRRRLTKKENEQLFWGRKIFGSQRRRSIVRRKSRKVY